jgi:putative tributyrin esterase
MKSLRVAIVLLALFIPFSAAGQTSEVGRVEEVRFESKLVGKSLPYKVVLPVDYDTSRTTRYPVLYLLHGLSGHYTDWTTRTNLADYAAQYRFIIVTPEGNDGWYTDSATLATEKYESYILRELIPDVDQRYRTLQARYARAIAGLSMGGYGAIKFGLKYPGTFAFAGSMSGAHGVPNLVEKDLKDPGAIRDSVLSVFGGAGSPTRKANDVFQMVRDMPAGRVAALPYFYIDCGTEDFLLSDNQQLAALLREKKIPHEYRELPGNHSWQYWDQQVQEILKIAAQKMRMPPLTFKVQGKPVRQTKHR